MNKHYLREWRAYRGLTIQQLSERTGLSLAAISSIERGRQRYNSDILETLSKAYRCKPADLISGPPDDLEAELRAILRLMSPDMKRRAIELIKSIRDTETKVSTAALMPIAMSDPVTLEESLVGALLYDNDAPIKTLLSGKHFKDEFLGALYSAIKLKRTAADLCDPVTMADDFDGDEVLAKRGGAGYLAELTVLAPPARDALAISRAIYNAWMVKAGHKLEDLDDA